MAKKSGKANEENGERSWTTYTATLTPIVLHDSRGNQLGRPVIVLRAKDPADVESILKERGHSWKSITIMKGSDPGLTRTGGAGRYYSELRRMISDGSTRRLCASDGEPYLPRPIPAIGPSDTYAKGLWAKFMDESSHGLSVSDFPRFVNDDFGGYATLQLPSEAVKDEKQWDGVTSVVRQQLDFWKPPFQQSVERLRKVKRRSAEEAEQLKESKATLKALEALDGWSYQRFVEELLPGGKPHPLDLDNLRLYRLSNGQVIPIMDPGSYVLRCEFWKRLLALWDGVPDKRAENVRAFLDHHHRKGGKPEQFRDLVKDTLPRLRNLTGRELLVDKLEGWLQLASAPPVSSKQTAAGIMPFEREAAAQYAQLLRDELPDFSICGYPMHLSTGTRESYPNVWSGIEATDSAVRSVEHWSGIDKAVKQVVERKLPEGEVKQSLVGWKYASLVPDGIPNPYDIPNPRVYLLDGAMIPSDRFAIKGRLSKAANDAFVAFQRQLKRAWTSPMNMRKAKVVEFLDHHFSNGGNPSAFVDFVEAAGPSISITGNARSFTYEEALQKELCAWVVNARKRLESPAKVNGKPKASNPTPPTLASKFERAPGSLEKWMGLLRSEGLVDETGRFTMAPEAKSKGKLVAAWVAAVEVFGLVAYPLDTELTKALIAHLPGLSGLDRLDKVRKTKGYTDNVESYKEALEDD